MKNQWFGPPCGCAFGFFQSLLSSTLAICGGVEWRSDLAVMAGVSPPRDAAMPVLPSRFATVILQFAPLFYHRSWRHAEVLLIGAILAPGRRTVASLLRICGLRRERHFVNYHRVLNRAAWSPLLASRLLLRLLIETFAPNGPVVLGLDDTIERRRGKRIAAKGIPACHRHSAGY